MRFPGGLRALDHPGYRRFFAAQFVSQALNWMQTVAQSWLVLSLTPSPFLLGLIGTLQFGPILLFSIPAGVLADRVSKRRLLVAAQVALGAQALALAALTASGQARYWHVAVLASIVGLANVVDAPARQALVAEMVGRASVGNAVALNSASFNAARIVGPALGGLLIARAGVTPAFALNAVGFALATAVLLRLREPAPPAAPRGSVLEGIQEGLGYARRTPEIGLTLGLLFAVSIFVFNFTVYVPLVVRTVLHLGAEGFGFLMAALGCGAVTGSLGVAALGARRPPVPLMFGSAVVACGGLLALGASRTFWPAAAALFVTGLFGLVLVASCNTWMQLQAPDHLRGRVMSLYTLVWGGSFPIGAFIVGTVSEHRGVETALAAGGTAGLAVIAALGAWWRRRRG
jgi:predicted MFS family arabinose efflux permease